MLNRNLSQWRGWKAISHFWVSSSQSLLQAVTPPCRCNSILGLLLATSVARRLGRVCMTVWDSSKDCLRKWLVACQSQRQKVTPRMLGVWSFHPKEALGKHRDHAFCHKGHIWEPVRAQICPWKSTASHMLNSTFPKLLDLRLLPLTPDILL